MQCWHQICMHLYCSEWKSELLCYRNLLAICYCTHITLYQTLVALTLGRNRLTDFVRSKSFSRWLKSKFIFWNVIIIIITWIVRFGFTWPVPVPLTVKKSFERVLVLLITLDAGQSVGTSNGVCYIPLSEFLRMKINSFNWDKLCMSKNKNFLW